MQNPATGDTQVPENIDTYYQDYVPSNIQYNGNDITNYERNWGPWGDYEAITYAEGRIYSQEEQNPHIANAMLQLGEIQDTSRQLFNIISCNKCYILS